jgi:hypothetical protein
MKAFILLLLSVTGSFAQPHYGYYGFEEAFIFTKQGDSIKGFLEVAPGYGSKVGYKKAMNDDLSFISTKEIKFVLTPNRYLENISVGKKELLMTMVANGKVRLFLQVTNGAMGARVFVVKKGAIYTEVKEKNYIEILSALLFDCPEVVLKIRDKVYAFEHIDKAVADYNGCQ